MVKNILKTILFAIFLAFSIYFISCGRTNPGGTPTASPTPTVSITVTPTATPTGSTTPTPTTYPTPTDFPTVTPPLTGDENSPLKRVYPSSHVLYHYYCPDPSLADKAEVASRASIINFGGVQEMNNLISAQPSVAELVKIRYRLIQYVQYMTIDGVINPGGQADLVSLEAFATANGYDIEDFFLHWNEPTKIYHLNATIEYDGTNTTLTDRGGNTHSLINNHRAMAIVWGDFYYLYDWHSTEWYNYIKWRAQSELNQNIAGTSFDGYFEDVLNGPITDTYQGIVYGGAIQEFSNMTPSQITSGGYDHALIKTAQENLNADLPGKVFMPNSGDYTQDWALETELAGDGTITENTNRIGVTSWKETWQNANIVGNAKKYFSVSQNWNDGLGSTYNESNYPHGYYTTAKERMFLDHAAFYWMSYIPGYVAFDIMDTACQYWATTYPFPEVMETDIGSPEGYYYQADSGSVGGWNWTLWARDYSGPNPDEPVTVYYRGNNSWRDSNGGATDYTASKAASFALPANSKLLRSDGTWADAPSSIDHMESFGFIVKRSI